MPVSSSSGSGGGGSVSSFTGDGTVLSNSGSTGAVTATLASQSGNVFIASPASGASGSLTARKISLNDQPDISAGVAGSGFIFGATGFTNQANGGSGTAPSTVANNVSVVMTELTSSIAINKVVVSVVANIAAATANFGFYTVDGNTKLLDSGAMSMTNAGVISATLGATVTLKAGVYYFAFACTSASVTVTNHAVNNQAFLTQNNPNRTGANAVLGLKVANALAAGALPTTLGGGFTTTGAGGIPCVMFET